MSEDATSRSNPTLFAEDSLVSHSPKPENSLPKTTPVTSGRKCLDLSGNAGPLGFVEKTLLGSSNWAWTKYSLTWKAKATPQGRLIYQLARLAPRTSDSGSGSSHTPTAKANPTSPSMEPGNWVSGLWQTPNVEDAGRTGSKEAWIKYQDQGHTPSCRLRNQVQMWPTPDATPRGPAKKWTGTRPSGAKESLTLQTAAKMWPTPTTDIGHERSKEYWEKRAGKHQIDLQGSVKLWPTPRVSMANGPSDKEIEQGDPKHRLEVSVQLPLNQDDPKITGSLNPQWVAWLMGYPTEYLSCVPWATRSSRKSRKK